MDPLRHLMLAPDSAARIDLVTDLAIPLVAAEGLVAATPRAIAELAGCTRQAVHQWFGDQTGLRHVVANRFTGRWARWAEIRVHHYGVLGLLPDSPDVRDWTRVWLALAEAAGRDQTVAECVAAGRATELDLVRARVGQTTADAVHALVEGLRWRTAADSDDFPAARAVTILASTLARLGPEGALGQLA
ncbi:TetR family transcriptional regulator C-terminal domain-containing protein [Nocardioides sp.]|uniref:TetR family transcriptional regulator C-terminal domain-containing protein n=1 Tax=Nocardioides sp. TaxID=35761 RepID=UPI002ED487E0